MKEEVIPLNRTIHIIGDINHEAYLKFNLKLNRLEREDTSKNIRVILASDGGDAMIALAFYDRIKRSIVPIIIEATGLVASAAVLILSAGDERKMTEESWVMVHDDSVSNIDPNMRVVQAEKHTKHYRRMEDQWNRLLEQNTSTSAEYWDKLHREETYLTPRECKELGLIDEIN
jgi:ATP-dependent protease ClpP protease subunit